MRLAAASAITVPGGKIAEAPASFSAVEILRRDDAADDDHDVVAAVVGELRLQFRHQGEMARGERRDADDVHVVLDRLPGGLRRGREERADIDVEAEIGEGGGDHLLAAVVAVLAHLGDEDARPSPVMDGKFLDETPDLPRRCRTSSRPPACRRPRSP